MLCMISAASTPNSWDESLDKIIKQCCCTDYALLARKPSGWSDRDILRQKSVISKTVDAVGVEDLKRTAFGIGFPQFVRYACEPVGGNYHTRMHNSNGRRLLQSLLVSSLGKCVQLDPAYHEIFHWSRDDTFYSVDLSTHTRSQAHSDPTVNRYTADVLAMGVCTPISSDAVQWLSIDYPRTPKLVIADAESQALPHTIENKVQGMKAVIEAYFVGVVPVLGLVVGGDMMMHAVLGRDDGTRMVAEKYASLDGKDLTEPEHLLAIMRELNAFFHENSNRVTGEIRWNLPLVRSRSGSSVPSHSSSHGYNLRSRSST